MPAVRLILAHPHLEHSRITQAVWQAVQGAAIEGLDVVDLYAKYPDYLVDVAAEQQALAAVQHVVWLHPIHWYSMPPLMKLWLDEVFVFGWAYGPGGTALKGKGLWLVTSTGGGLDAYSAGGHHRHAFDDFLLPYHQTARLTGMCLLPTQVLHAAHRVDDAALAAHVHAVLQGLRELVRGVAEVAPEVAVEAVPVDERPAV
jgi:glutathione-regulated potassium-efflux system ancillary protein KefF